MSNLAISPTTGDLIIGRGATRVTGVDYVAQLVRSRIRTILGEWQFDTSLGIDMVEMIGRKAPLSEIERKLRILILGTNHVRGITSMTLIPDYRARQLSIQFSLTSDFGSIEDAVINIGGSNGGS